MLRIIAIIGVVILAMMFLAMVFIALDVVAEENRIQEENQNKITEFLKARQSRNCPKNCTICKWGDNNEGNILEFRGRYEK